MMYDVCIWECERRRLRSDKRGRATTNDNNSGRLLTAAQDPIGKEKHKSHGKRKKERRRETGEDETSGWERRKKWRRRV